MNTSDRNGRSELTDKICAIPNTVQPAEAYGLATEQGDETTKRYLL